MDEGNVAKREAPLATHCDNPLTFINQRKALLMPAPHQYINPNNPCRQEWNKICRQSLYKGTPSLDFAHVQSFLIRSIDVACSPSVIQEMKQQHQLASRWAKEQYHAMSETCCPDFNSPYLTEDPSLYEVGVQLYTLRTFWEEAVLSSGSKHNTPRYWWKKREDITCFRHNDLNLWVSKNLFFIQIQGLNVLASREHLLILSDLLSQRYMLYNLCLQSKTNHLTHIPEYIHIEKLLRIHDDMLHEVGNSAYKTIYSLEPLCISYLVGDIPLAPGQSLTFRDVIEREIQKEVTLYPLLGPLHELRKELLKEVLDSNIASFFQMYGLYRLWGHPTLEPLDGVIAIKQIATNVRIPDLTIMHELSNKFKEEMIIRIINKTKIWPQVDTSELSYFNPIRRAHRENRLLPVGDPLYNRSHLSLVHFKKQFNVDPKFDLSEMLADKAMSLTLDELKQMIISSKSTGSSIDRSVLIQWMKSDLHDPEEFLMKINATGFSPNDNCGGVREKEREGKLKARLFGLMTLTKRTYIVLTEALLAEHLLPLFPEITMTDDEQKLEKKRMHFTGWDKGSESIFVSLDFSKWNTNMRDIDTRLFFSTLDELFGFQSVFSRTHEMFDQSLLYLLDGSFLPPMERMELKQSIGSWRGHLGGIEGLRQKGWTIWTVILILLVVERHPITVRIMGQGDNQILKITFPPSVSREEGIVQYHKFIKDFENVLSKIGPPLKLEETWASSDLFLYGKFPVFKGVSYSMSLKKACRAFKNSNEDYPTLESTLSSLAANIFSGMASDHSFRPFYVPYLMECVGAIQRFMKISYLQKTPALTQLRYRFGSPQSVTPMDKMAELKLKLNDQFLVNTDLLYHLLMLPRSLGGLPVLHLTHCLLKGSPDPLSFDLATLKMLYPFMGATERKLIRRWTCPLLSKNPNFIQLFENPTSISLDISSPPSEARKNVILDYLTNSDRVKNRSLKEFLILAGKEERSSICEYLSQADPMNPRVLSVFYESTATARALKAVSRMNKSPTISQLYKEEGDTDLYTLIEHAEIKHLMGILINMYSLVKREIQWSPNTCSVDHATRLRNASWRRTIIGVECVPPHEFGVFETVAPLVPCTEREGWKFPDGHITYRLTSEMKEEDLPNPCLKGSIPAYRGSLTRNKIEATGTRLAQIAPPFLKSPLLLMSIRGWAFPKEGNLDRLALALLEAKTDLSADLLSPDETKMTGSVHHRLRDSRTDSGGVSPFLPTFATRFSIDTSPLCSLNKGTTNKTFMFQTVMIFFQSVLSDNIMQEPRRPGALFHLHVRDNCCVKEVDETPLEIIQPPPKGIVYSNPHSPYLYMKAEKLEQSLRSGRSHHTLGLIDNEEDKLSWRFHNLLAEEVCRVIDVQYWDHKKLVVHSLCPIMVSWALHTDMTRLLPLICLKLLAQSLCYFFSKSVDHLISRIVGKLKATPGEIWGKLYNLAFAPCINHLMALPPYYIKSISAGEISPMTFGLWIRSSIIRCLQVIGTAPHLINSEMTFHSSTSSMTTYHPILIEWIWSCILSKRKVIDHNQRLEIMNRLTQSGDMTHDDLLGRIFEESTHELTVTTEAIDYLSKAIKPPQIDTEIPPQISSPFIETRTDLPLITINETDVTCGSIVCKSSDEMKHYEKDWSGMMLRPFANPTTAPYKLLSILNGIRAVNFERKVNIACLADGMGGFTVTMARLFSRSLVFHNTLLDGSKAIPQLPPLPFLPAATGFSYLESRIIGREITNELPSDITDPLYPEMVAKWVQDHFHIVTGDAEGSSSDPISHQLKIFLGYQRFCRVMKPYIGIFKTYADQEQKLSIVVSLMFTVFKEVVVARSFFSTPGNTEVYLVCFEHRPMSLSFSLDIERHSFSGTIPSTLWRNKAHTAISILDKRYRLVDHAAVKSFTEWLMGGRPFSSLGEEIYDYLPWAREQTYESSFPENLITWIRSYHKRSNVQSSSKLKSGTLQSFSKYEIHYFIEQFLIVALYDYMITRNEGVDSEVQTYCLVWFRRVDRRWSFLFVKAKELSVVRSYEHIWIHRVQDYIVPANWKMIYRMVGIAMGIKLPLHFNRGSSHSIYLEMKRNQYPEAWMPLNKDLCKVIKKVFRNRSGPSQGSNTPSLLSIWEQQLRLHQRRRAV